jgi:hypothetical protein
MTKALAVAVFVLASCKHYRATPPDGFAAYVSSDAFRAVSADGVIFRVHEEKNEPQAELAFWKEAFKRRMKDAGYGFVSDADVTTSSGKRGYTLELNAPQGAVDYGYFVTIFVSGSRIVVAEAAGEVTRLAQKRAALATALEALDIR